MAWPCPLVKIFDTSTLICTKLLLSYITVYWLGLLVRSLLSNLVICVFSIVSLNALRLLLLKVLDCHSGDESGDDSVACSSYASDVFSLIICPLCP